MEQLYIFSKLSMWEADLLIEEKHLMPSAEIINAIIDYSLTKEIYSPTLKRNIVIGIN